MDGDINNVLHLPPEEESGDLVKSDVDNREYSDYSSKRYLYEKSKTYGREIL